VIAAFEAGGTDLALAPADFGIPLSAAIGCEGGILNQAAGRVPVYGFEAEGNSAGIGAEQFIDAERSRNITEKRSVG